jgi:uncharacterized protein YlxW (UPF0749 family)
LLDTVTARPSRGQLVTAVLLAVLGAGAVIQMRATEGSNEFAGARRGDLVQLLDSLSAADLRAREQLQELEAAREELRTSSDRAAVAAEEARREANELAILSGLAPATGPGVRLTVHDPRDAVGARIMLNAIEELRDAGAEVIAVNGVARVVAQTWFADSAEGITIDGTEVEAPYEIVAIGDPDTLAQAVSFRGGLSDEVESVGGSVHVTPSEALTVSAVVDDTSPQYSQPAP